MGLSKKAENRSSKKTLYLSGDGGRLVLVPLQRLRREVGLGRLLHLGPILRISLSSNLRTKTKTTSQTLLQICFSTHLKCSSVVFGGKIGRCVHTYNTTQ
jgi:hypothetical protein